MKNTKRFAVVILCAAIALIMVFVFAGRGYAFNYSIFDFEWEFNRAIIKLQDGSVVSCGVKAWKDFENSDQIQIEAEDGRIYLVHSVNCTLINDNE